MSIDAGHVRTARGHQGRTFEVMAAQVSNDDGKLVLFSGVPGEADQQRTQLNGVLTGLGMTTDTEVTILSDGADGPRSLGEAASTGTVFHVLDWFHLAMRIQHAAQCASGWPDATVRRPPGRCAVRRCGRAHPLAPLAWPDRAGAPSDPAHTGGRQSEGGRKNRRRPDRRRS